MRNNNQNNTAPKAAKGTGQYLKFDTFNNGVVQKDDLRKEDLERPVVREFISVSKHLDDDFVELMLAEARHRARIPTFLERVAKYENPPEKYERSPRNLRLPEFIQKEWIDKGFLPAEIDRQMLAAYDEKIVRAIENYEYNNGLLDEKLRFLKAGNKRSRREMISKP